MTLPTVGTPQSAAEMMRALGVTLDGPTQWGNRVASGKPGVFVVELPGGAEAAPIDIVAVRRWVEGIPDLLVDGAPATAPSVARRLESMWLPFEPILYVGRSARAIGARVAAMYATPLGEAKPYSGGYWIKTLTVLRDLRVWWAETDAHEEYQDALLSEIRSRSDGRLPFANLTADGATKEHGLANTFSGASEAAVVAGAKPKRTTRKARATRAGTPRTTTRQTSRRRAVPTYVSQDGLDKLGQELGELKTNVRPQVIARVKAAREFGDLKENGDYEYARKEQSFVEGRIQALEQMIKSSVIIEAQAGPSGAARLGSTVVVENEGEQMTYVIVGPTEADPRAGRISYVSPVGAALVGAVSGDERAVQLPAGTTVYLVREVR